MNNFNYFSKKEQGFQTDFQKKRDHTLSYVARCVSKIGITPNGITVISFLSLAPFVFYAVPITLPISLFFLVGHVLLDGLDGVLARYTHSSNNGGAFLDMLNDHTGMVVVTGVLVYDSLVDPTLALIYVYLYTILVLFIVMRNVLNIPLITVFRSKYALYSIYALFVLTGVNVCNYALVFFCLVMLPYIMMSIPRIYSKLRAPDTNSGE